MSYGVKLVFILVMLPVHTPFWKFQDQCSGQMTLREIRGPLSALLTDFALKLFPQAVLMKSKCGFK